MTNNTSHIPDSLLEKIQKLIRLKEDKAASQGEIENATKMITALLLKYNLEMSQVIGHGLKEDQTTHQEFDLNGMETRHQAKWVSRLFVTIAKFNLCRVIVIDRGWKGKDDMGRIGIVGTPANIEIVYYLVDQLRERILLMAKDAWKWYLEKVPNGEKRNTFYRGYLTGAVSGIHVALKEQELLRQRDEQITLENKQMGLMIRNQLQKAEDYMTEQWKVKKTKSTPLSGVNGRIMGFNDGKQMGIHKGVGGSVSGYLE